MENQMQADEFPCIGARKSKIFVSSTPDIKGETQTPQSNFKMQLWTQETAPEMTDEKAHQER